MKKGQVLKKKIIKSVILFVFTGGLITFLIYGYFLSFWAYLPFWSTKSSENFSSIFHTEQINSVIVTPKANQDPASLEKAEAASTQINKDFLLNPGIRDGKFTSDESVNDEMSYYSKNISIEISMFQNELITYYVAEIYIRSSENIYSGLSNGIDDDSTQTTTEILNDSNGVFAINGDFYNSRDGGVIIRNGELLRDEENRRGLLVLFNNGVMQIYDDENISGEELLKLGAEHSFCFGPKLVENGNPVDNFDDLVRPYIRQLQPRCAVGQIEPYHYVFVIVDGRAPGYSQGVTLVGLSDIMYGLGCKVAYNLDGGGSTSMVLLGNLINKPVGRNKERAISDAIVIKESDN